MPNARRSGTAVPVPPLQLISILEACQRYSLSTDTIRRRIADGTIAGYRAGGRALRVDLFECDEKLLERVGGAK